MATEIANFPTMIQHYAQSLEPQQLIKHRVWIGVRVEALMDPYWDRRPPDAVKDEILRDWFAALENYSPDEITRACRKYADGIDRQRKPKTGDIVALMDAERGRALLSHRPSQPQSIDNARTVSPDMAERAQQIIAAVYREN